MAGNNRKDLCRLIFEATEIPICKINVKKQIEFQYTSFDLDCDPIHLDQSIINNFDTILHSKREDNNQPVMRITEQYLNIGAVPCREIQDGFYLLGPVPYLAFPNELSNSLIKKYKIKHQKEFIHTLMYELPRMVGKHFGGICNLVYFYEWGSAAPAPIFQDSIVEKQDGYSIYSLIVSNMFKNEDSNLWTLPINKTKDLVGYILEGNTNAALRFLDGQKVGAFRYALEITNKTAGYMSESLPVIDDVKLERLIVNSFASYIVHAVVTDGFDEELAWIIWYYYVEKANKANTVQEINSIFRDMVIDYSERHVLSPHGASKVTLRCIAYIKEHLAEKISLKSLASYVGLSPRYLMDNFRREMGISLNQYIQQERINSSKILLAYTSYRLIDICDMLNFSSQSYFTSVFKRFVGLTPQAYRDQLNHD